MDHTRKCQSCAMRAQGYRLQYFDPGSGVHLGHYHTRYLTKKGERFWLWHMYLCAQCKSDGTLVSRLTFSAPKPEVVILEAQWFTLPLFSTLQEKPFPT